MDKLAGGDPKLAQLQAFAADQGSLDFGNIHLSFGGKMRSDFIERFGFVLLQEPLHGALAGIVGGQCEAPIAEPLVEDLKILGGSGRAFLRF